MTRALLRFMLVAFAVVPVVCTVDLTLAFNADTLVTVGSPTTPFPQNKQNEPAIAVDPSHPAILVAGANDELDLAPCHGSSCPFTPGVGLTGVYFSFDSGTTWTQPTYTGWTARDCSPTAVCAPHVGPIGTVPFYFESGLVSGGDPALAFGPQRGPDGKFSWANGVRLYVANLTANFSSVREEEAFMGFEAVAVSRIDGPAGTGLTQDIVSHKGSWMPPVIASQRQSATTFGDKEQIWADNASSSPFFGNVYVCFAQFRSIPGAAAPLMAVRSTDGGDTWEQHQITAAVNITATRFGQSGCTIRTDSKGVVYVFYEQFESQFVFLPPHGRHMMVKSFDGGESWTRPVEVQRITDPCFFVDPVIVRCVMDGVAGARNDLSGSPSVSIANGAPTGNGATDEIVDVWVDAADGLNNESVTLIYSTDGGKTWAAPMAISEAGDRGYYTAPALSPDGDDLYVVYNAFTTPFRDNTSGSRGLVGVLRHADIGARGTPISWSTLHRGPTGDPRGSSQNGLTAEFLGDYVYATATNTYGAAVWNDVRNAADCPALDAWRSFLRGGPTAPEPKPIPDCPPTFGNSKIFGGTYPDPTP